jgi:hypothetical protein
MVLRGTRREPSCFAQACGLHREDSAFLDHLRRVLARLVPFRIVDSTAAARVESKSSNS